LYEEPEQKQTITEKQQETINALEEYRKQNEKLVKLSSDGLRKYTTGRNYFIKVGNKFL
jgi:hypothetical protein